MKKTYNLEVKPFSECTWAEIKEITDAYYAGVLNPTIATDTNNEGISITWENGTVWKIGDKQVMHINHINSTGTQTYNQSLGVDNSVNAKKYRVRIIGINHDDLTSGGKALITLNMESCLWNKSSTRYMSDYCDKAETLGLQPMDDAYRYAINKGGWRESVLRVWLQNNFYKALDDDLKSCVKEVKKKTYNGCDYRRIDDIQASFEASTEDPTTFDKIFLLSEVEVSGSNGYSHAGEGTKYPYYSDNASRCKAPKWDSSNVSGRWWLRSAYSDHSVLFCFVDGTGAIGSSLASRAYGISAAFCI